MIKFVNSHGLKKSLGRRELDEIRISARFAAEDDVRRSFFSSDCYVLNKNLFSFFRSILQLIFNL